MCRNSSSFFAFRIASLGDIFYRRQKRRADAPLVEYHARVEQHQASTELWKLVLDLVCVDDVMFRNDIFQELFQRGNIPPSVGQVVEHPALGRPGFAAERLVKGTARGHHAQVAIEHHEGLANGVHNRGREALIIFLFTQTVVIDAGGGCHDGS